MTAFGSDHLDKFKKLHKKIEFGGDEDGVERKEGWRKGKYGDEWRFSEEMPDVRSACLSNGKLTMGGYDITIDPSGKYLRRRLARL